MGKDRKEQRQAERKDSSSMLQQIIAAQKENEFHYLCPEAISTIAARLDRSELAVLDTATFYGDIALQPRGKNVIRVCASPTCRFAGKRALLQGLEDALGIGVGERSADGNWSLEEVGCLGACDLAPAMLVNDRLYGNLTPQLAAQIVYDLDRSGPSEEEAAPAAAELQHDGAPSGLERALGDTPQVILERMETAGLRGRGGAFFPTAIKWRTVREAAADEKYIVCNADEGEPGTFKDRFILLRYPQKVVEGMVIAGYVTGARKGYIYLRGEYGSLYDGLSTVLKQMEMRGDLGCNIRGRGFDFAVEIRLGAGAYICGEETALLESLEGKRGLARSKPSLPAQKGLWGKPTLVNNVETFLCAAELLEGGPAAYIDQKYVCISGCVNRPGVYRVPFGTPVETLIDQFAGGVRDGDTMRFLHIGGLTGCCIDAAESKGLRLDVEALKEKGLTVGTGAIFVGGSQTDILEYLLCALDFYVKESCGKCVPCREGLYQLRRELQKRREHPGWEHPSGGDGLVEPASIHRILDTMEGASNCGLGQGVPKFVRSMLALYEGEEADGKGDGGNGD